MKKIIVVLLSVSLIIMNCKSTSSSARMAGVATLPLAAAAYEVSQETSAKACNYELGLFTSEGLSNSGEFPKLAWYEWYLTGLTGGLYFVLFKSGDDNSMLAAAVHRALKKTDGDVLFEMKSTKQVDGFLFPDVCVTVSGKAANLTGPSVTAKK